jgi:hypothetical protein
MLTFKISDSGQEPKTNFIEGKRKKINKANLKNGQIYINKH